MFEMENDAGDLLRREAILATAVGAPLDFTAHRNLRRDFVPRDRPALAPPPGVHPPGKGACVLKHQLFRTTHQSHQFRSFGTRKGAFVVFPHQLIKARLFFWIEIFHTSRVATLLDLTSLVRPHTGLLTVKRVGTICLRAWSAEG